MVGIAELNITMPIVISCIPAHLCFLKEMISTIIVYLLPSLNKMVEVKSRYKNSEAQINGY